MTIYLSGVVMYALHAASTSLRMRPNGRGSIILLK